jgi:hypothetical protein
MQHHTQQRMHNSYTVFMMLVFMVLTLTLIMVITKKTLKKLQIRSQSGHSGICISRYTRTNNDFHHHQYGSKYAAVNLRIVFIQLSEKKLGSKEKINNLFMMTKTDPNIQHSKNFSQLVRHSVFHYNAHLT